MEGVMPLLHRSSLTWTSYQEAYDDKVTSDGAGIVQVVTFPRFIELAEDASLKRRIMSSIASTSKTENTPQASKEKKVETAQHLGVLEEDDEFEEFAVAGRSIPFDSSSNS